MALSYNDITNLSSSEASGLDQRGYAVPMMRTTFYVRGAGPYWVELPKKDWTADAADKAVRAYAQEICALLDKYPQG